MRGYPAGMNIRDDFPISPIVLGGGKFSDISRSEEYYRLMDRYLGFGGNCIDTARVYCALLPGGDGLSETIIGNYMNLRGNRNRIRISTKGGHPPLDDMKRSRLGRKELTSDLEMSLKALGTDHADIYFLHRDDPDIDLHELMYTLDCFVREGKVLVLGASNFTVKRILDANKAAAETGCAGFEVSQIGWSLAETTPERYGDPTLCFMNETEYRGYLETGIPVMAYSPQAKGFFAADGSEPEGKFRPYDTPENRKLRDELQKKAGEKGVSPALLALEHITKNQIRASAVAGVSNSSQLEELLGAGANSHKTLSILNKR